MYRSYVVSCEGFAHHAILKRAASMEDMLRADLERPIPRTWMAHELRRRGIDADALHIELRGVADTVKDAMVLVRDAHVDVNGYSIHDDGIEAYDAPPRTTYPSVPTIDGERDLRIRPWTSRHALDELERAFFTDADPLAWFPAASTVCDITADFFYDRLCCVRSYVADAFAYDARYRQVVVTTEDGFVAMGAAAFAKDAVPWVWTAMEHLCLRVLQGCRHDANAAFAARRCEVYRAASHVLRVLTEDRGAGRPANTVAVGFPGYRALVRRRDPATHDYDVLVHQIIDLVKRAAHNDPFRTHEKLRRIYPAGHERQPSFIKVREAWRRKIKQMQHGMGVSEVITITPQLRADVRRILKSDQTDPLER